MNTQQLSVSAKYKDILVSNEGSRSIDFVSELDPPVSDVSAIELLSYSVGTSSSNIEPNNNRVRFEIGPNVAEFEVADSGFGYDTYNSPNLFINGYRQSLSEYDVSIRSIGGVILRTDGNIVSPNIPSQNYDNCNLAREEHKKDDLKFYMVVDAKTKIERVVVISNASDIPLSSCTIEVEKPFDFPYAIHICKAGTFNPTSPRLWCDTINIKNAFVRYVASPTALDIDILGEYIAEEVNRSLGWTIKRGEVPRKLATYGYWGGDGTVRYQCRYLNDQFFLVDLQNEGFTLGDENCMPLNMGEGGFPKMTAFGGLYPCATTIWHILAFAKENKTILPGCASNVKYTTFDTQIEVELWGYQSAHSARVSLVNSLNFFKAARAAVLKPRLRNCTAVLRPGYYSIGTVKANDEIIRQAGDGLLKELQDQMNIAYFVLGNGKNDSVNRSVGDVNNPNETDKFALHRPRLLTDVGHGGSPHHFLVTLEDANIYDGILPQSSTNIRTNQQRKTRVRVSFAVPGIQTLRFLQLGPLTMLGFTNETLASSLFTIYRGHSVPIKLQAIQASSNYDLSVRQKVLKVQFGMNSQALNDLALIAVAGRPDFAGAPITTDGSEADYNDELEHAKGTLPLSKNITRDSGSTRLAPMFRGLDFGARRIDLESKQRNVAALRIRIANWYMHSSEAVHFILRLHHSSSL